MVKKEQTEDKEITCINCGRIYRTQIGLTNHKCPGMDIRVAKRKLTEQEQLYHDIIVDGKHDLLDKLEKNGLEEFKAHILAHEPDVKLYWPNAMYATKKKVSNL